MIQFVVCASMTEPTWGSQAIGATSVRDLIGMIASS